MSVKTIKVKKMTRTISTEGVKIDSEARTMEFPFSSELPVERWFGSEVLSHEQGAADLSRVNDGAPLLWNHDPDKVIGVVENANIADDKRGYAKVRFANNALAQEKFKDIQDGILRNISFGYQISDINEVKSEKKNAPSTFVASKWLPYEISVVSVPADNTVGIGRDLSQEEYEVTVTSTDEQKVPEIKEVVTSEPTQPKGDEVKMNETEQKAFEVKARNEAEKAANDRVLSISALGEKHKLQDLARQLIEGGKSVDEARAAFLEKLQSTQKPVVENTAAIDLTEKEKRSYSLINAIRAQINKDWSGAGFERELSLELAKRMGKETNGFFMPTNIRMDGTRAGSAGSYQAGSATLGGNLVQTSILADSFIDLLRNKMLVMQLGAKVLSGLTGNVAIPKQTGAATAYWVSELADVTESEGTFGQVTMSPKTVGARSQMSRTMMMQGTPDIETLVRNDLALVIALALDSAAISGTGSSGQPKGILNQTGIGSVAMGTNGAAFTNIDPLIDIETAVATANADIGSLSYLTNPHIIGALKKLKASTGEYLWNGADAAVDSRVPGTINGYGVARTNQVPANLTKGTSSGICSAMIFGNFGDLLVGQWGGGVEILANPFGAGFNNGGVDIRALTSVDIAIRNAGSFAAITDAL